ncbi:MAG: hypothetical protein HY978_01885 [Candidatus Liptonbacteria bacterium]|nr:hypothetical protein [Candidatus Liptonbacteria bacterium]
MEDTKYAAIQSMRHIVGNHIAEGRLFHAGEMPHKSVDDIREIQRGVAERLEKVLNESRTTDSGALEILGALKGSDWGGQSSYEIFLGQYNRYVMPVDQEAVAERDRLFRKR